jgi:hypothetical protein
LTDPEFDIDSYQSETARQGHLRFGGVDAKAPEIDFPVRVAAIVFTTRMKTKHLGCVGELKRSTFGANVEPRLNDLQDAKTGNKRSGPQVTWSCVCER